MMYLVSNRHPDIAFAVHQCARFTHCVKSSHENSMLWVFKYLDITQKEGLILRPNKNLNVECYTYADVDGLYGTEDPQDPICGTVM